MPEDEGPVVVDETRGDSGRNRDPELDQLMKYLSELSENIIAETDDDAKQTLIGKGLENSNTFCLIFTFKFFRFLEDMPMIPFPGNRAKYFGHPNWHE